MRSIGWMCSLLLLGLAASGCPDDAGEDTSDATTSAETSASGPTGGPTGGPTSAGTEMTADGSGTGASLCGDVDDEEVGPAVTIRVVNARAESIWLPLYNFCYSSVPYSLTGPEGTPVAWVGPDCGTCQSYAQGNCACPGAACSEDVLLQLEPGAIFERSWSGGQFVGDMLPEACPGVDQCGASCQRAVQAPDGSYSLEVQAGSMASGCLVEPCACEPFDGMCTVWDPTAVVDDPQPYAAVLEYPSATEVEITID